MTPQTELLIFSVVIPTLDRPEHLRLSLESLAQQQFPKDRFEVIVVDDGGAIPAQTVATPYTQRISITVIRQKQAGPAGARNAGAAKARAKYIVFMDDDCRACPEWLQELETAFERSAASSLLGGGVVNAAPENVFAEVGELILGVILDNYRPMAGGIYFFRAANLAASCSEFHRMGGFDVGFLTAEDREFCDRWLHAGGSLVHVPNARVSHLNRLSFRGFCRQHFMYGKGAFHFHRLRRERGSGRFDIGFPMFYFRVLRAVLVRTRSRLPSKLFLLLTWQIVNVAGFMSAMLASRRVGKKGEGRQ